MRCARAAGWADERAGPLTGAHLRSSGTAPRGGSSGDRSRLVNADAALAGLPLHVGPDGRPALPWLAAPLADLLPAWRSHALLLHLPAGQGALPLAVALAQAALCEASPNPGPGSAAAPAALAPACGRCGACRLAANHAHPDLLVVLPEALRRALDWLLPGDKPEPDDKKAPSRQLRVDEVRAAIDWVRRTSGRGRGKVLVLHPAEAMNEIAASALLKTLEEPPAGTRILLTTADPAALLPTVRSRCQRVQPPPAPPEAARDWLAAQGVADPAVLLAACAGRPLEALDLHRGGLDAAAWAALPAAVAAGRAGALAALPPPRLLDTLAKLCHDALAVATGAAPRYFPAASVPAGASVSRLLDWAATLRRLARHDDHPWNGPLLLDSLVAAGHAAWVTPRAPARGPSPAPGGRG
jgi:DNA polymerase-3 subunit delta'